MVYRVLGQGPPLLLCPGLASTYRSYALLLNVLSARFRTVVFDYPGDHPDDGARLRRITHDDLVDDVFRLIEHLNLGRAFLVGLSFGSTIVLQALRREPRRFPRSVLQGGFAHREFTTVERAGLALGRLFPGRVGSLPFHDRALAWNSQAQFPTVVMDRWPIYVEENAQTPIAALAHRLDLLARLDLRPVLPEIKNEVLLLHGNEDRIVTRRYYEELVAGLSNATGAIMPQVGHQPHITHAEALGAAIGEFLLPCNPTGCPNEQAHQSGPDSSTGASASQ